MKLTFEQIQSVTFGAVCIEQQDDGIHFFKCTKKQLDGWYSLAQSLGDRALTTTGIRLDFHTDASEVSFTVDAMGPGTGAKFVLLINDVTELCSYLPADEGEYTFTMALPAGENRVTFVLPSHNVPGLLKAVELKDASVFKAHEFDTKIIFIGDSITQGYDAVFASQSYANKMAYMLDAEIVNQAIGGEIFRPAILDEKLPFAPDLITVAFGTND